MKSNTEPRIEFLAEKKLIGKRIKTSLSNNKTFELWQSFMPQLKNIKNRVSMDLISMQVYDSIFDMNHFNEDTQFDKWAATEVTNFDDVHEDLETFTLSGGLYAVFIYKGVAAAFAGTFKYIMDVWLPNSGYILDNQPHFEVLGAKYKNNDPSSEEEIWIPIKSVYTRS